MPVSKNVLLRSGEAESWIRVDDAGRPSPIGLDDALSFEGVRKTVEEVGSQLSAAWDRVEPSEAVEFGADAHSQERQAHRTAHRRRGATQPQDHADVVG